MGCGFVVALCGEVMRGAVTAEQCGVLYGIVRALFSGVAWDGVLVKRCEAS